MLKVFLSCSALVLSFSFSDILGVIETSRSGMLVQQQKLRAIAENVANINTVKTINGEAYQQKKVVVKTDQATKRPYVAQIIEKEVAGQRIFDPTNANADENGFVFVSDYSIAKEMTDMAETRRLYEANAAVFSSAKQVAQSIMNLGK